VAWIEAYLRTKWHLDPSSHLATTDMAEIGDAVPLFRGELGPYLAQCALGQGLPPYQVETWSIQPFGHKVWAKNWGLCLWGGRTGSPSNAIWPGQGWGLPSCHVSSWSIRPCGHNASTSQI